MHQVGAAWLMISMTDSPLLVGLLQTAGTLPVFLVGLPAGVLADLVSRRTMLLVTNAWMLVVAAALAAVNEMGGMTPGLLLLFTFLLGIGGALSLPVWQATVPHLVPREMLGSAVSLNSMGFNTARAVGPAIGGLLVAASGPSLVFMLNACSFVGVLGVFGFWRPPKRDRQSTEDVLGALRAGVRYILYSPPLHAPLVRVAAFMFCGAVVLALLPLVAREVWQLDSGGYGLLLAAFGVGSIIGAAILPGLRRFWPVDGITAASAVVAAVALLSLGSTHSVVLAGMAMFAWGVAWTTSLVNYNVAMQMAIAGWVRGRSMAFYQLVLMGSLALGSWAWGWLASVTQPQETFLWAAGLMVSSLLLILRYRLAASEQLDARSQSEVVEHEFEHHPTHPHGQEEGAVLVTIEYRIRDEDAERFREIMRQLRILRKRDGAAVWRLYRDSQDSQVYIELYRVETWAEHLRGHERRLVSDQGVYDEVRRLHVGPDPPRVAHYLNVLS